MRPHFLAGLTLAGVAGAAAADGRLDLGSCDGIAIEGARCGVLEVLENRQLPAGRRIALHVMVVPATGDDRRPDPVFYFFGGPGTAPSAEAARAEPFWRVLGESRDLVFIDQRGTGRSAPLRCEFSGDPGDPNTFAIDLFDIAHLTACRDRHAGAHDLAQFATGAAVLDADAVRAALGYDTVNVVGESYGTRVAQEFVRRHPDRVRAALLLGAVPPSASVTEGMAESLDAVLEQLFAACEADRTCEAEYPGLRETTATLLRQARVDGFAAEVSLDEGPPRRAAIPYQLALAWLRSRLYSVTESARLPRILSQAARGDARELVRGALRWRRALSRSIAEGMYASVACAEDMPFVDVAKETAAAQGTRLGDHRVASQQRACRLWPRAAIAGDFKEPIRAPTPILVVNGDRDPATGLGWARAAAREAPNARLVVARNRSHDLSRDSAGCIAKIAKSFIDAGDTGAADAACASQLVLPPFEDDAGG